MKKVLNTIKKIIIGILAVIFFGFAVTMTILLLNFNKFGVSQFGDTTIILVKEKISSNNFKKGDLVFVGAKKLGELKEGEEVFAYKVNKDGTVTIDLGTIDKLHKEENAITFKNGSTYAMEFVIGKANKVYPNLGAYLSIIESKWGFLFIILVPSFLIFIYEIYALIIEVKYGKEEAVN